MDKTELMKDVLKVTGIAPIIAYAEPEQAVPAAKALVAGGLPVVEVLMRNEHAMGNLERIARDVPEIVAGAGTIITLDQAKAAIDKLIKGEDPKKPLSDQKICTMLKEQGLDLSRRTVMKYREQLGYASSVKRKRY